MTTLLWRPETNALTTPISYRARPVTRSTLGYEQVATAISARNPTWTTELIESVLRQFREEVKIQLSNGNRVNLKNGFNYFSSIATRLDTPTSPMPPAAEVLRAQSSASRTFLAETAALTTLERAASTEKAPVIDSGQDVTLELLDVVQQDRTLRLTGNDLAFDPDLPEQQCLISHPVETDVVQDNFGKISTAEVLVVSDLPTAANGFGVFQISISTRYTENGSLRTGTYSRFLRAPVTITVDNLVTTNLLGDGTTRVFAGALGPQLEDVPEFRIQAVIDSQDQLLRVSLLSIEEDADVGDASIVTSNGDYPLTFTDNGVSQSLPFSVTDWEGLYALVQTDYLGRCVDVIRLESAP